VRPQALAAEVDDDNRSGDGRLVIKLATHCHPQPCHAQACAPRPTRRRRTTTTGRGTGAWSSTTWTQQGRPSAW